MKDPGLESHSFEPFLPTAEVDHLADCSLLRLRLAENRGFRLFNEVVRRLDLGGFNFPGVGKNQAESQQKHYYQDHPALEGVGVVVEAGGSLLAGC